jgi:hypothetical protein
MKAGTGFSTAIDLRVSEYKSLEEWQKHMHVIVVINEMHVKEDFVYEK